MMNSRSNINSLLPPLGTMRHDLRRAFSNAGYDQLSEFTCALCPISLWHDDATLYIEADVPGMSDCELDVSYDEGRLWIRGERRKPEGIDEFDFNQRHFGKFERAVKLPDTVDPSSIEGNLIDGVLRISLAKKPEAQPRTIEIKHGGDRSAKKLSDESSSD